MTKSHPNHNHEDVLRQPKVKERPRLEVRRSFKLDLPHDALLENLPPREPDHPSDASEPVIASPENDEILSRLSEPLAVKTAKELTELAVKTASDQISEKTSRLNASNARTAKWQESYRRRNLVKTTIRFEAELAKKISLFCAEHGIDRQEFHAELAVWFFNPLTAKKDEIFERILAVKPSHDDMMIFNTHDDIIMRYREMTGREWTPRDDRAGRRYNEVDRRLIEIAFVTTLERKLRGNTAKQPVKSFLYFTTEIDILIQQQNAGELPAALDEYHRYVLSVWENRIRPLRDEKWAERRK
jgi:hypothetical protein